MSRTFFAHPKHWQDEEVDRWVQALIADGAESVVPGRDDYQANIAIEMTIDSWIRSIARRRDLGTGQRVYALIVVPGTTVGKATAHIVRSALEAGIPVASVALEPGTDKIRSAVLVRDIDLEDAEDFTSGWSLVLADT